jgi:hypothetical protein
MTGEKKGTSMRFDPIPSNTGVGCLVAGSSHYQRQFITTTAGDIYILHHYPRTPAVNFGIALVSEA